MAYLLLFFCLLFAMPQSVQSAEKLLLLKTWQLSQPSRFFNITLGKGG